MSTGAVKYESSREKANSRAGKPSKPALSKGKPIAVTDTEDLELLRVTSEAREQWKEIIAQFDYVHEEMLIDYYTYMMKACEARYAYYLKLVKDRGLTSCLQN